LASTTIKKAKRMTQEKNIDIKRLDVSIDGLDHSKLMALVEDRAVGTIDLLHVERKAASFRELFVDREYRRGGIGKALVKTCEQMAIESGCEYLGCLVAAGNHSVVPFYLLLGFEICYEHDDGMLILTKRICQFAADEKKSDTRTGDSETDLPERK
jgi:GNAT superfamily N-acetyltransferase